MNDSICLGESFASLSFAFRIGERTISSIVDETCRAIFAVLNKEYLQVCGRSFFIHKSGKYRHTYISNAW